MEPRVLQHDVQGQGEPIVLVPDGLTGWLSWIPHQERLAGRYRAIRVQPIHNESTEVIAASATPRIASAAPNRRAARTRSFLAIATNAKHSSWLAIAPRRPVCC